MSSLWTPGGEVPVDRNRSTEPTAEPETPPEGERIGEQLSADDEAIRAQVAEMQAQMLAAPAEMVVVQHAVGLYELAALHLSQETIRLDDAKTAIDAFAALVEGMAGRLGEPEDQLTQVLTQLRLAFVDAKDRQQS